MDDILLDIVIDILGEPGKSYENKSQYSFDCPVCSMDKGLLSGDGKHNLEVNLDKGVYKCWACSETHDTHGTVYGLISKFGNHQHLKKYKIFRPEEFKSKQDNRVNTIRGLPKEFLPLKVKHNSLMYDKAISYLKKRGIDEYIIDYYDLHYVENGEYKNRIIIPSLNEISEYDYYVGRLFISGKNKYKNPDSPKTEVIFNVGRINWDSTVYLVEGPFDHIIIPNSIPLLGKVISDKLFEALIKNVNVGIVICLDSDAYGDAVRLFDKLNIGKLRDKIRIAKIPDGYDISEVNKFMGKKGIVKILRNSSKIIT